MEAAKPETIGVIDGQTKDGYTAVGRSTSDAESKPDEVELQGRKNMWIILILSALLFIALLVMFIAFLLPEILELLQDIGDELRENKGFGMVVVCALGCTIFNVAPIPGRAAWNLITGYVFGWGGLPIIWFGHGLGGTIAFFGARLLWPYLEGCTSRRCCCCFFMRDGDPRKPLRFLLACVDEIEARPMQTVFLLTLSPCPLTLLAYVLGAKCLKTAYWQFFIPMMLAGVKFVVPTYLGVKADDLKALITGDGRDAVDTLFTFVSVIILILTIGFISRLAYRRVKRAAEGIPPPTPAQKFRYLGCCCFLILVGLTIAILDFVILGRLTPLYEPLELEFIARTTCVNLQVIGELSNPASLMLNINNLRMDIPMKVLNKNPVEATVRVSGIVDHGITTIEVGGITTVTFPLSSRGRSWGGDDPVTQSFLEISATFPNSTLLGLPAGIPITEILAAMRSGGTTTAAPIAACSIENATSNAASTMAYLQCMAASCEDSDTATLSGSNSASCTNLVYLIGCDVDLNAQYPLFPRGSYVRFLCSQSCDLNSCVSGPTTTSSGGRRLEEDGTDPRYLQASGLADIVIPVVASVTMSGKAKFKVLGKIQPSVDIDTTRYLRQQVQVNPTALIAAKLAEVDSSNPSSLQDWILDLQNATDFCSEGQANPGLCADTKAELIGNTSDVIQRPGVRTCAQMGPNSSTFDEQEEAKWIYSIFFFVLSCCCMTTGCFSIILQGLRESQSRSQTQSGAEESRMDSICAEEPQVSSI